MSKRVVLLFLLVSQLQAQVPDLDWLYSFGGSGFEILWSSKLDSHGNIVNVGLFNDTIDFDQSPSVALHHTSPGAPNMFVLKLDPQGNFLWVKTLTSDALISAVDVATDGSNHIYVSGIFAADSIDFDPDPLSSYFLKRGNSYSRARFVLKLDSQGNFKRAIAQGGNTLFMEDIELDGQGNIYMSGSYSTSFDADPDPTVDSIVSPTIANKLDAFVEKLDTALNKQWIKFIQGGGNSKANAVALNDLGEPLIAGEYDGSTDFDPGTGQNTLFTGGKSRGFLLHLNNSGAFQSVKSTTGTGDAKFTEMKVDRKGYIYLGGSYSGLADLDPGTGVSMPVSSNSEGWFVEKLDPAGNFEWAHPYENNLHFEQTRPMRLAIDQKRNVYCAGYFYDQDMYLEPTNVNGPVLTNVRNRDIFLTKHDSTGAVLWGHSWGTTDHDRALSILLDNNDAVILSGYYTLQLNFDPYGITSRSSNGDYDCYILKLGLCPAPLDTVKSISACKNYKAPNGQLYYTDTLLVDTLVSIAGCDSAIERNFVQIYQLPTGVNTLAGRLEWDSTGASGSYSFLWYDCDTDSLVPGANQQNFRPASNGNYAMIISDGSCSDTSACFNVSDVGLDDLDLVSHISLYPNPTEGTVRISGIPQEISYRLQLFDALGQEVGVVRSADVVDLQYLPKGVYHLRIELGEHSVVKKLIKN